MWWNQISPSNCTRISSREKLNWLLWHVVPDPGHTQHTEVAATDIFQWKAPWNWRTGFPLAQRSALSVAGDSACSCVALPGRWPRTTFHFQSNKNKRQLIPAWSNTKKINRKENKFSAPVLERSTSSTHGATPCLSLWVIFAHSKTWILLSSSAEVFCIIPAVERALGWFMALRSHFLPTQQLIALWDPSWLCPLLLQKRTVPLPHQQLPSWEAQPWLCLCQPV